MADLIAAVVDYDEANVYFIDTVTNTVVDVVAFGGSPDVESLGTCCKYSPTNTKLFVANAQQLVTYTTSPPALSSIALLPGGDGPFGPYATGMAVNSLDRVFVSVQETYGTLFGREAFIVAIFDSTTETFIGTIAVGANSGGGLQGPADVVFSPDETLLYVLEVVSDEDFALQQLGVIDYGGLSLLAGYPIPGINQPNSIAIDPFGVYLVCTDYYNPADDSPQVYVVETTGFTVTNTVTYLGGASTGTGASGVCVLPDGSKVYVANLTYGDYAGVITVIDPESWTVITQIYLSGFANGPVKIAALPDSSAVYVTGFASGEVYVINTTSDTVVDTITGLEPAGAPWPIAMGNIALSAWIVGLLS